MKLFRDAFRGLTIAFLPGTNVVETGQPWNAIVRGVGWFSLVEGSFPVFSERAEPEVLFRFFALFVPVVASRPIVVPTLIHPDAL